MTKHTATIEKIESLLSDWGAIEVKVTDNSHLHVGHEGAKSGGGHFAVEVHAAAFKDLSRIKSHRLIYQQLNSLFTDGSIHALEVDAIAV